MTTRDALRQAPPKDFSAYWRQRWEDFHKPTPNCVNTIPPHTLAIAEKSGFDPAICKILWSLDRFILQLLNSAAASNNDQLRRELDIDYTRNT